MTRNWAAINSYDPFEHPDDLDQRARTRAQVDALSEQSRARSAYAKRAQDERLQAMFAKHNAAIDPDPDSRTGYPVTDDLRRIMGAAANQKVLPSPAAFHGDDDGWDEEEAGLPAGDPDAGTDAEGDQGGASGAGQKAQAEGSGP